MKGRWIGWLLLGAGIALAPLPVDGQERPRLPRSAKAADAAPVRSGDAARDRAMQAEAHYELGVMHHERVFESLDQAIAEYEKAVKLRPDYAEVHYHLGLSYHTKAKLGTDDAALYKKALAAYKKYLSLSPKGELAGKAKQNIKVLESRIRR